MNAKEILKEQMNNTFRQKNWFVSLEESLQGLTNDKSSVKKPETGHSVKEIATHLIFWNERYLNLFKGNAVEEMRENNDYTFSEKSLGNDNISWEIIIERLKKVMADWQRELDVSGEKKLLSAIPNGSDTWYSAISNIILHTAYHLGQIVCLRKEHGNWDSNFGVQ